MAKPLRTVRSLLPAIVFLGTGGLLWSNGHPFQGSAVAVAGIEASAIGLLFRSNSARWLTPALIPLLLTGPLGLYAYYQEAHQGRAVLAAGVGLGLLVLLFAGVEVARYLEVGVSALARAVTGVVGAVAFAVVVLPGWAWTSVRRGEVLRGERGRGSETGWNMTGAAAAGMTGDVPGGRPRSALSRLTWTIGCVVLLLAANYGIGWSWDRITDRSGPNSVASTFDRGFTGDVRPDPRTDEPAMAAYPWRTRYFADIQRTTGGYWPFTESRPDDFRSRYVNQDGWTRRTWQPPSDDAERPTLWMFGGSTTWGEGQRDGYTIASWISRLAAEAGVPLRVRNYGQRGWTHFQEMVLYEQRLAIEPDPDFSVFYDGANELTTQSLLSEAVPSHTLAYTYAQKLGSGSIKTAFTQPLKPSDPLGDIWHAYSEHSALHKVARWLGGSRAGAVTARPSPGDGEPGTGFRPGQEEDSRGGVYNYDVTDQDGRDAGRVYERGKRLTMALSKQYGVRSFLFWQPVRSDGSPQQLARAELTKPTIDISQVLAGHQDVYIDGGHTNEEGARLVAGEIWKHVEPAVRRWYATH